MVKQHHHSKSNQGNKTGGFIAPINALPDTGQYVIDAKLADLNNNGQEELVLLDSAHIGVASRTGSGTFATPVLTSVAYEGNDFAVADFDHDGLPNLAFTEDKTGSVHLWMNDHPQGFRTARRSPLKRLAYPKPMAVGDFNGDGEGDGELDVAAGDDSASRRAVWLNQ